MRVNVNGHEVEAVTEGRTVVLELINNEMERTEDNAERIPNGYDYISDLVRYLNGLLPREQRYFEGE